MEPQKIFVFSNRVAFFLVGADGIGVVLLRPVSDIIDL